MKNFLACLFCFSFVSLFAIEGTYKFTGTDPYDKKGYSGTAVITKDQNNVYQAEWNIQNGGSYKGTGILQNEEISFVFAGKYHEGVQIYQITGNSLQGSWVYLGQSLLGSEKMVKK